MGIKPRAASVVHTVLTGGTDELIYLSVPLKGEYGYDDVYMSVPVTLSSGGWGEIEWWELSDWERNRLDAAYRHLAEKEA